MKIDSIKEKMEVLWGDRKRSQTSWTAEEESIFDTFKNKEVKHFP